MKLLEIGGNRRPSVMMECDEVEYVGVDPNYSESCYDDGIYKARVQDLDPDIVGQFDYIFAANVLSNRLNDSERFCIVRAASKLLLESGQIVFLEEYAPVQANLRSFAPLVDGVVVYDRSPIFKKIWSQHRQGDLAEVVRSRTETLKIPMQMLVNNA
ncbi:hypothetical protein KDA00_03145 [Candidatus Saccharibacteria bacterium]|nr:hypothetical protein [Candidatus Saccharibacteria bacterium]